ncbi:glycosyltransferase [Flaviramulus aquimarinus]|uniref:Glycosyltransferase n=1 Tax=Flaviramulus aquimarinus TaxID=1170456 RepID=A0ABP9EW89_9FLAO
MILISILLTSTYLLLIGSFVYGFDKIKRFKRHDIPAKTKFSIVIPFRNEAKNLPKLLTSIAALKYPKQLFEIIFVDDASEDTSVELIMEFMNAGRNDIQFQLISNKRKTNAPKKDAITTAISIAKYEWIITTDADCILPKYWLDSFDTYIQNSNTVSIAAPVTYFYENTFLNQFQLLDMLSLQGATIGGFGIKTPFLCNGANFAYNKQVFIELNGFEGNTDMASGDDVFLLEKIVKAYPKQIHYLKCKEAIVVTRSQPFWHELISQRVRWAAKTSAYNNMFGKFTGLVVLMMNGLIIATLVLALFGVFNFKIWFYILIIKFNIDFYLIYKTAVFFNQANVLRTFAFGFIIYPFFSIYVAFISVFSSYKWKGRNFEK